MLPSTRFAATRLAWLAIFSCIYAAHAQTRKPNIIIVYVDDLGYADLSVQGLEKDIRTPHIDALAKQGIRFTNGYVTAPQCSPSRAGLISGRYQSRFGFDNNEDCPIPAGTPTIASYLSKAGYATGQVGKWHLEPDAASLKWVRTNLPAVTIQENQRRYETPIPDSLLMPYMPGNLGFAHFFTGYISRYFANFRPGGQALPAQGAYVEQTGYRLDIQTDAALQFIKDHSKESFFLYLAYYGPHLPLDVTEKYLSRFPASLGSKRRTVLAMMAAIDDGVGQLMGTLRQQGIAEQTMIVFASDNGAPLNAHSTDSTATNIAERGCGSLNTSLNGEKGMLTEGGIRVPFIIYYPKLISKPRLVDWPVSTLDLLPTAVELAGGKPDASLDGMSLVPYLKNARLTPPDRPLYWRFWGQAAIRMGRYKLLKVGNERTFLFDLVKDPAEKHNILSQNPAIAEDLSKRLTTWGQQLSPAGLPPKERPREKVWYDYYTGAK